MAKLLDTKRLKVRVLLLLAAAFTLAIVGCGDSDPEKVTEDPMPEVSDTESESDENDASDASPNDEDALNDAVVGAVANVEKLISSESTDCSFDRIVPLPVEPICYSVSVPENWDDPDLNDQVILQVAVFEGDGSHDDPYIYLDGGPGGSSLDLLSTTYSVVVQPLLNGRDFIVFDQRGVGLSEPSLACPEYTEVLVENISATIATDDLSTVTLDAFDACSERLESNGVDLQRYNSVASASDVEAIRIALGYDLVNPVGISYGTRLGQTFMRLYPDSIRSIVLDSVFPTSANLWTDFGPGAERAFSQLFAGCSSSPECSETYPEFEEDFFRLLDQLDVEPAKVTISNLVTGKEYEGVVYGDDVLGLVFQALYSRSVFSIVPEMTELALDGNFEHLELIGSIAVTNLEYVAVGMQMSVECNEELAFESDDDREANISSDPRYTQRLEALADQPDIFLICDRWPSGSAIEIENELVVSDLPTLLLAGEYDPITPPSGMDTVAVGLSNSHQFTFPHEGHGMILTACGSEIIAAFVDEPTIEPDSSCIADSPTPAFVPSVEPEAITMVDFSSEGLVAVSGIRPDGWTEAAPGTFARVQTALDPTTVLVQPSQGQSGDVLSSVLASQIGLDFKGNGDVDVGGKTWSSFVAEDSTLKVELLMSSRVFVVLVADPDEFDSLRDTVLLPMAVAAEPS